MTDLQALRALLAAATPDEDVGVCRRCQDCMEVDEPTEDAPLCAACAYSLLGEVPALLDELERLRSGQTEVHHAIFDELVRLRAFRDTVLALGTSVRTDPDTRGFRAQRLFDLIRTERAAMAKEGK